jgi:GDP-L-fucose synthase
VGLARQDRIVVTGGKGFLGRHVVEELRRRGHGSIVALGSADFDLTRAEAAQAMYREHRPATVIHLAAAVGGIGANRDNPGWFSFANTMMGAHVLEGARETSVRKVLVIGTICVYPANAPVPTPEAAMFDGFPADDTAPYGIAKRNLWMMGVAYRRQYGLNTVFLIPTNLYGPHDHFEEHRSHVIPALIRRCIEAREAARSEVVIWGDGTATREFLYVEDAARGIVDALERYESPEPLNLGSGREVAIRELAEMVRTLTRYPGRLTWDASRPGGAPRRSLDVERARRELGFAAATDLARGLERTVAWYERERQKG